MSLKNLGKSTNLPPNAVLKLWRTETGKSARAVSLACGLSASYVSKVESGAIVPPIDTFAKIAEELNLSEQQIIFMLGMYL